MKLKHLALSIPLVLSAAPAFAFNRQAPADCDPMTVYNYSTAMCEGKAMPGMPMTMIMVHGNGFVVATQEEGPRGRGGLASPNMLMADLGRSVGDRHYLNLDVMLTLERWTYPEHGYPLLLQIGEENADHEPYLDAQHPHSSPLMGLTVSDTFTLGETSHLKVFAAPRGESTDGPTAFMHRPSGEVNPDAPLGHHIGQDVGHITSSVIGAEIRLGRTGFEVSTFKGEEPEPAKVDLPVSSPDSYAFRLTQRLNDRVHVMGSVAYVRRPEPHDPDLDHIWRYSFSAYWNSKFESGWSFHGAFVYGLVNFYDEAGALNSFLYEAALRKNRSTFWGRAEALERTPDELQITDAGDRTTGRYVGLLTLGYTHEIAASEDVEFSAGASVSRDFLPSDYRADYGGNPLTGRVFLQVSGMKMFD